MGDALGFDAETLARAAVNLARKRMDAEGGEGTYDDMVAAIAAGGARAPDMQRALGRVSERAERNVRDVLGAISQALAEGPGRRA